MWTKGIFKGLSFHIWPTMVIGPPDTHLLVGPVFLLNLISLYLIELNRIFCLCRNLDICKNPSRCPPATWFPAAFRWIGVLWMLAEARVGRKRGVEELEVVSDSRWNRFHANPFAFLSGCIAMIPTRFLPISVTSRWVGKTGRWILPRGKLKLFFLTLSGRA